MTVFLNLICNGPSGRHMMRPFICLTIAIAVSLVAPVSAPAQSLNPATLPPWQVPELGQLALNSTSQQIRLGRELIDHTTALIGPDANDPSRRYSGSGLECSDCHLHGGTERFALPLVGIYGLYPRFSARQNSMQTLSDRINDCMVRSVNGRPLPPDDPAMAAILAYIQFLSRDQPVGVAPVGRGVPRLPLPVRAADPSNGAQVYQTMCSACHRPNGQGVRFQPDDAAQQRRRYLFPPLWGPDSYNDAAGMQRGITFAWFAHANMPNGITFTYPLLGVQAAYDVAAYVNQHPRPHLVGLEHDYPDRWLKPVDATYPPFLGPFTIDQHRYGPWQPILNWVKANRPPLSKNLPAANDMEESLSNPVHPTH